MEKLDVSNLPEVVFSAGDTIVEPGDGNRSIFLLVDGAVEVLFGETQFRTIRGQTTFIGELAALAGVDHSAHVRALDECTCYRIDDLRTLYDENKQIYERVAADIAEKTKVNMLRMLALRQYVLTEASKLGLSPDTVPQLAKFMVRWQQIVERTRSAWPSTLEVARESDEIREYAAGEYLFVEGHSPGKIFVLIDGRVSLEQNEPGDPLPVHSTPGAAVNLTECIPGMPPYASARAVEPTKVRVIDDLPGRFRDDPEFGISVTRTFAQRLLILTGAVREIDASLREVAGSVCGEVGDKLAALIEALEYFDQDVMADTVNVESASDS